jgi:hypothetical protein
MLFELSLTGITHSSVTAAAATHEEKMCNSSAPAECLPVLLICVVPNLSHVFIMAIAL